MHSASKYKFGTGLDRGKKYTGKTMIRVLHFAVIINRYDFIDTVLTTLDRNIFQVSALTIIPARRQGPYKPEELYHSKCLNISFRRSNYFSILRCLIKEIKTFKPHIIQSHHYEETLITYMALKFTKVPCWVIGHHYSDHIFRLSKGIKLKTLLWLEKKCNNKSDMIVVPSLEVFTLLTKKQGVSAKKVKVISYGADIMQAHTMNEERVIQIRKELNLNNMFIILTSCRLSKEKGLDFLLHAVGKLVKDFDYFRLIMLGDGPEKQKLEMLVDQLYLGRYVKMVGWKNNVMDWMAMADVVVQPSLSESFCQVLTESLLMQTPVIMTPVGAAPDIIGKNERGIIINQADSDSIYEALKLLMSNQQLGKQLGITGKKFVEENLSLDKTALLYEDIYKALLKESGIT